MEKRYSYEELLSIVAELRSDHGCPWDKVQTHETLKEAMIEEAYEVVEAINKNNIENWILHILFVRL